MWDRAEWTGVAVSKLKSRKEPMNPGWRGELALPACTVGAQSLVKHSAAFWAQPPCLGS